MNDVELVEALAERLSLKLDDPESVAALYAALVDMSRAFERAGHDEFYDPLPVFEP